MLLFFIYAFINKFLGNATEKQKSWILTLIVSFVLSFEGYFVVIPALIDNVTNITKFALSTSPRSFYYSIFFVDYCISELFLAFVGIYPLQFLEGLCHHTFYIGFISILNYHKCTNSFWMFLWCEIPTFILALNGIFNIKTPFFSVIFFVFRVFLFGIVLGLFFSQLEYNLYIFTLPPAVLIFGLHMSWAIQLCAPRTRQLKNLKHALDP
jgi:hypothetical protein